MLKVPFIGCLVMKTAWGFGGILSWAIDAVSCIFDCVVSWAFDDIDAHIKVKATRSGVNICFFKLYNFEDTKQIYSYY